MLPELLFTGFAVIEGSPLLRGLLSLFKCMRPHTISNLCLISSSLLMLIPVSAGLDSTTTHFTLPAVGALQDSSWACEWHTNDTPLQPGSLPACCQPHAYKTAVVISSGPYPEPPTST